MKPKTKGLILAALLAAPSFAWAHGDEHAQHVKGTVAAVTETRLDIDTRDEKRVRVVLTEDTELLKLDGEREVAATRDDLVVDRRVVVDVEKDKDRLVATRVVIAAARKSPEHEHHEGHGDHGH